MRLLALLIVLFLAVVAYVRLAPTRASRWHRLPDVTGPGDISGDGSFISVRRVTVAPEQVLAAVERLALATPRTTVLKGSVAKGMITFQTRSAIMGFPDHTTVAMQDDLLVMHGRLRFGRKDFGVNRARIAGWLETLDHLTERL